ncbi:MAG: c-type cytochrome [Helicobacteraceae bacterium]|nr:c-type cytochrome [Helicobacteraceae bacterium]
MLFLGCNDDTSKSVQSVVDSAPESVQKVIAQTHESVKKTVTTTQQSVQKAVEQAPAKANEVIASAQQSVTSAVASVKEQVATLSASEGKTLFAKCASCHGANAEKKALGKSAVIAGLSVATLESDLKAYKAGKLDKNGMGALMKSQTAALSDAQISELAKYINSL